MHEEKEGVKRHGKKHEEGKKQLEAQIKTYLSHIEELETEINGLQSRGP